MEEVTVEMEVAHRVRALVENSLPYLDAEEFNSSDDRRWAFVCFVVGCVFGTKQELSRAQAQAVSIRVIVEVFEWPAKGVLAMVSDAMQEADQGLNREIFEAGMKAIAEFESAVLWLNAVCEAVVERDEINEAGQ